MKRSIPFSLAILSLAMFLSVGLSIAAPERDPPEIIKEKPKRLPPLSKELPESIEDLRAMEKHAQQVLEKVLPSTVCIQFTNSSGSGVIVTPEGLVLTAGHVSQEPGTLGTIVLHDGKKVKAKSLGRNGGIDSGMMQILEAGPFPHVEMGNSSDMKVGQWCICIGHPGGLKPHRGMVVRVGRILVNDATFIRTDCHMVGGDSGGPLFNTRGEVIGINSRIGPKQMTENIHVPVDTFHQTWDRLVKGEDWGNSFGPILVQSAEGKIVMDVKGDFSSKDPFDAKMTTSHFKSYTMELVPGFAYTIDMRSKVVDSFLRLEDSDGKQVAENDDGGGEQDSRIVYRPARQGIYKIYATTFDGGQTGAYTLTVRQADIVVKDLPSGKVNVAEILKLQQAGVRKNIEIFENLGLTVFANAHLFDDKGKPIALKQATFVWKSGKTTVKSDDQGQVRVKLTPEMTELMLEVPEGLKAMVRMTDKDGTPLPFPTKGKGKGKGKF
jgi:serine protease Do